MQLIDGKTIRNRRRELNMTLEECCEGICSLSYLSMIENGKRPLTIDLLEKFTARLGLNELNAHSKFSLQALFTSGLIAVRSGATDEAEQILSEMPDSTFRQTLLGLVFERKGHPQASIGVLRPVLSEDIEPTLFLLVANSLVRQLFQEGEIESAMEIGEFSLRKAIARHRPLDDALLELRGTLANAYAYLGDAKRGLQLTQAEPSQQDTKWSQVIDDWSNASLQMRNGDMAGAAVYFRRAFDQMVEFDRPIARARLLRAAILARLLSNDLPDPAAREELVLALKTFESSGLAMDVTETRYAIACLELKLGNQAAALVAIDETLQSLVDNRSPKSLILQLDVADLLMATGQMSRGEALLKQVQKELDTTTGSRLLALAWSRLAAVNEKLGRKDEAFSAIKKSVAIAGFASNPISSFSLD